MPYAGRSRAGPAGATRGQHLRSRAGQRDPVRDRRGAAPVAVVTMADGCDDPRQIDDLARLVDRGVVVAAASRYMPGGQQVGGPRFKRMSRGPAAACGCSPGSAPATPPTASRRTTPPSSARWASSRGGFEIGIELTAKATRLRCPSRRSRRSGSTASSVSQLRRGRFLPSYLRWYRFAFGRAEPEELTARPSGSRPPTTPPSEGRAQGRAVSDQ